MPGKAAVIIYTREKYIGFPKSFLFKPEDLSKTKEEKLLKNIFDDFDHIAELRNAHKISKIIISDEEYALVGIVAFLRDILGNRWDTTDKGNRPVYGFVGFVWHKSSFPGNICFPEMRCFAEALEELVMPHWNDSENSSWANQTHLTRYDFTVTSRSAGNSGQLFSPPGSLKSKPVIIGTDKEDQLIDWGMRKISSVPRLSICTNMVIYSESQFSSDFMYVTNMLIGQGGQNHTAEHSSIVNRVSQEKKTADSTASGAGGEKTIRSDGMNSGVRAPGKISTVLMALLAVCGIAELAALITTVVMFVRKNWGIVAVSVICAFIIPVVIFILISTANKKKGDLSYDAQEPDIRIAISDDLKKFSPVEFKPEPVVTRRKRNEEEDDDPFKL